MFIDTNVFLYGAENDAVGARARTAFLIAREKGACISPLIIDEIVWALRKQETKQEAIVYSLRRETKVKSHPIHATAGFEAFDLMRKHNLKPRDALHVAVMLANKETEILSNDPDFDHVPGITRTGF